MSAREYWAAEAAKRQRVPISGGGGESRAGAEGALMAAGALHSHLNLGFFRRGFESSIHASCVGAGGDEAVDSTLKTLDSEQSQQPSEKLAALLAQLEVRPQSTIQQP